MRFLGFVDFVVRGVRWDVRELIFRSSLCVLVWFRCFRFDLDQCVGVLVAVQPQGLVVRGR